MTSLRNVRTLDTAKVPGTITDRFQRVFNAATQVVSGTRKIDHGLSQVLHSKLHWLDIPQRVQYKLGFTVHRCLSAEQCSSVPDILLHAYTYIQRLKQSMPRSTKRRQLMVPRPRHHCSTFGRQAFSVADPMERNLL